MKKLQSNFFKRIRHAKHDGFSRFFDRTQIFEGSESFKEGNLEQGRDT